ncbi:MAG TPA: alpha/beta hydrolase [Treponemataceae bacterium]|jgi:pimeloyl-ACP methyl ester carboxylesterase|nr:alpha/beta hydrolase [Treponemataceae bacterium]
MKQRALSTRYVSLIVAFASFVSCASSSSTGGVVSEPVRRMRAISYPLEAGSRQDCLVVLLPGIGDKPEAFARAGFVDAVHEILRADCVAVGANYRYYRDQSVVLRLKVEVIEPARAAGYRRFLFVGTSLGGFGSLAFAELYPEGIESIVLLAPFLGNGDLDREFARAGGLAGWAYVPGKGASEQDRKVREVWHWLQGNCGSGSRPRVYLAYGDRDKFRADCDWLARELPADRVLAGAGKHDWVTWARLFRELAPRLTH